MTQETSTTQFAVIPASQSLPEITLKAVILAIILTAVLGAANAYLALKVGQTISASIPAAVLSMGILRLFRKSNILENNLVQTAASAGEGVAAAIAFVLPALLILGYWNYFHYWSSVLLTIIGGALGVLFSIPLRKILLNYPTLRFPEGTAIGEVLKSSTGKTSLRPMVLGGLSGALIVLAQTGFKVVSDNLQFWAANGKLIYGIGFGFSPALIAAGYIVGIQAGIAMFAGVIIGWIIGMPILTLYHGLPQSGGSAYDMAMTMWSTHIRYIGVGTMLLGGAWTLITLIKPIGHGIYVAVMASVKNMKNVSGIIRTERDLPMKYVGIGIILSAICVLGTFYYLIHSVGFLMSPGMHIGLSLFAMFFILIGGFFVASLCAYMSGLVGMSNTPMSGLLLGSVILSSLILLPVFEVHLQNMPKETLSAATTIVILITTMVAIIAAICGENMQDLKAGQIVGATPFKQQIMIFIGVIIAALVVSPVLELLYQAYGMGGVMPHAGMNASQMLPAPQAGLIAAVAQGVLGHTLRWADISIGVVIAFFAILADEWAKKRGSRVAVLGVGLGIYLPPDIILPIVIGGFINYAAKKAFERRKAQDPDHPSKPAQYGILLACGMVAGAALVGVLLAIPFVIKGSSDAWRLVSAGFVPIANVLGAVIMLLLCFWFYWATQKKA